MQWSLAITTSFCSRNCAEASVLPRTDVNDCHCCWPLCQSLMLNTLLCLIPPSIISPHHPYKTFGGILNESIIVGLAQSFTYVCHSTNSCCGSLAFEQVTLQLSKISVRLHFCVQSGCVLKKTHSLQNWENWEMGLLQCEATCLVFRFGVCACPHLCFHALNAHGELEWPGFKPPETNCYSHVFSL